MEVNEKAWPSVKYFRLKQTPETKLTMKGDRKAGMAGSEGGLEIFGHHRHKKLQPKTAPSPVTCRMIQFE
jgi:hypothetical protein